jgi:cytochrome P450
LILLFPLSKTLTSATLPEFSFKPERWFSPTLQMKDAFMPFGAGTRGKPHHNHALEPAFNKFVLFPTVCIGLHLAKFEIALGTISFFEAYPTARVAPQMTDDGMEFENFFLIAPKGHKCLVVL